MLVSVTTTTILSNSFTNNISKGVLVTAEDVNLEMGNKEIIVIRLEGVTKRGIVGVYTQTVAAEVLVKGTVE